MIIQEKTLKTNTNLGKWLANERSDISPSLKFEDRFQSKIKKLPSSKWCDENSDESERNIRSQSSQENGRGLRWTDYQKTDSETQFIALFFKDINIDITGCAKSLDRFYVLIKILKFHEHD